MTNIKNTYVNNDTNHVKQVEYQSNKQTTGYMKPTYAAKPKKYGEKVKDINEANIGKMLLSSVAAVLILLAAGVFVGVIWEYIPYIVKSFALIMIGMLAYFAGLKLYDSKGLYPYMALAAIGTSVSFIGIIASRLAFNVIGTPATAILIVLWSLASMYGYLHYRKMVLSVVTNLGILISSILIGVENYNLIDTWTQGSSIYFIMNTVLVFIPMICYYIFNKKNNISNWYKIGAFKTAEIGIAIYLISTVARLEEMGMNSGGISSDFVSILISVLGLAAFAVFALKINDIVLDDKYNFVVSAVETQILLIGISAICAGSLLSIHNMFFTLGAIAVISVAISAYKYRWNYIYSIPTMWILLNILFNDIIDIDYDIGETFTMAIFVAMFIGVTVIGKKYRIEKVITSVPMIISAFVAMDYYIPYSEMDLRHGEVYIYMLAGLVAIVVLLIDNYITDNYDRSQSIIKVIQQIFCDLMVFVWCISFVADQMDRDVYALLTFAMYLISIRFVFNDKLNKIFNNVQMVETFIVTVAMLIIQWDLDGAIDNIVYTLTSVLLISVIVSLTFIGERHRIVRVLGVLIVLFNALNVSIVYSGNSGYIGSLIMILVSSMILVSGFLFRHKEIRITSLISLMASTVYLVYRITWASTSMGTVIALLLSGVLVLAISVVYSKLEDRLINSLEEDRNGTEVY